MLGCPCVSRIPRRCLVEPGSTNHCVWRAHNLAYVLDSDAARLQFLGLLATYKSRYGILIHSYCIMGTHPHVVCTSTLGQPAFSAFWKVVNQRFACWYNRENGRRGQVVMQRTRSLRIKGAGGHQLTVMRYGDLNPVRAGIVRSPKDWPWSSYRHYAFGERNDLVDTSQEYLGLGRTRVQRQLAYRHLFAQPLSVSLRMRRPELVDGGFIGDEAWVKARTSELPRPSPD